MIFASHRTDGLSAFQENIKRIDHQQFDHLLLWVSDICIGTHTGWTDDERIGIIVAHQQLDASVVAFRRNAHDVGYQGVVSSKNPDAKHSR